MIEFTKQIFIDKDIKKLLTHIMQKVKDHGHILMTTFSENSFSPLIDRFLERLTLYNINVPNLAWKRVATKKQCTSLFKETGLKNIKSKQIKCGYYLHQVSDWWYILWNGGFRRMVNQLSSDDLVQFKKEHLAEVKKLATKKGIWLEMNILYTIGTK